MIAYTLFVNNMEKELKRDLCTEELEFVLWLYERYQDEEQQHLDIIVI
ncbi:hypothetical protein [Sediminibacillus albus]|uniref:Uncharacterized protein n=1 Tax=Sediminibacillus albus TaxID=407036 RepID=A0A1G8ZN05_9BACI|nr:hypothetical protein [Sediminibacillus albus]SDK16438.1 hypothetical protein SAMN05216243_2117 [Sediminibacillus albus]